MTQAPTRKRRPLAELIEARKVERENKKRIKDAKAEARKLLERDKAREAAEKKRVQKAKPNYKHPWPYVKDRYVKGYDTIHPETGITVRYYPKLQELSEELSIPFPTIAQRCSDDKWVEERSKWQTQLELAKEQAAIEALKRHELRIRELALKGSMAGLEKAAAAMEAIPTPQVPANAEDKQAIAEAVGAMALVAKVLPSLTLGQRTAQQTAHVAIGLPKDGVKAPAVDTLGEAEGQRQPVSAWARMRASRQEIVVAVQVNNTQE